MSDLKEIEQFLKQWKQENRSELPINIDTWKTKIVAHQKSDQPSPNLEPIELKPFFKPISRLIEFKNEQ